LSNFKRGDIVTGKVVKVMNFGAFVKLSENQQGLIHISKLKSGFVKDVNDVVRVDDEVKVKILNILGNGKIDLLLLECNGEKIQEENAHPASKQQSSRGFQHMPRKNSPTTNSNFEEKLKKFMRDSQQKISDLNKRGKGKKKRG